MKLGDVIQIKHGYAFSGKFFSEDDNGIVLVTPGNFALGGGFQQKKNKYFTGEYPQSFVLNEGDIIVTMTDLSKNMDTIGYSAKVPSGNIFLHNQRIGLVSFISNAVDPQYIYWLMRSPSYQRAIAMSSNGSTVHHTSPAKIYDYEFNPPSITIQKKIASILTAYDDMIDNCKKQIALLEEAAQRLYREWFVDLHFPGYESTPIGENGLPEGWKKVTLESIADYVNGFAFKPSHWYNNGTPIIKIKELNDGITDSTPRYPGDDIPKKYHITSGDIIFSWSATLTAKIWNSEDGYLNQHLFKVIPYSGVDREYVLQSILKTLVEFKAMANGSTMQHIQRGKLSEVEIIMPTQNIMELYHKHSDPIRKMVLNLSAQKDNVLQAFNLLLPRLISGQIEIKA